MGLADKLESIFNIETEATIESTAMEFVTAGENIAQKTIIPFTREVAALSFALELGDDIDEEFSDVSEVLNRSRGIPLELKKGVSNPDTIRFSSMLPNILYSTMKLMPSYQGKSRQELKEILVKLREEALLHRKPDTIDALRNQLNR